jgi:hypothetical protein
MSCSFIFSLLQNWRTGGWNRFCPGGKVGTSGRGEVVGKEERESEYSAKNMYTCM